MKNNLYLQLTNGTDMPEESPGELYKIIHLESAQVFASKLFIKFENTMEIPIQECLVDNLFYYDSIYYRGITITGYLNGIESEEIDVWKLRQQAIPILYKVQKVIKIFLDNITSQKEKYFAIENITSPLQLLNFTPELDHFLNGLIGYYNWCKKNENNNHWIDDFFHDFGGYLAKDDGFVPRTESYANFLI